MDKPSENDFVNDGLTEAEINDLNAGVSDSTNNDDGGNNSDDGPDTTVTITAEDLGLKKEAQDGPNDQQIDQNDKADKDNKDDQPKTVDIRALQEARDELRRERENTARVMQRTNQLLEAQQKQMLEAQQAQQNQQAQDQLPPDDDPAAQLKWLKDQHIAQQQKAQEQQRQLAQQQQTQNHQQSVIQSADQVLQSVSATDPVLSDAFEFAATAVEKALKDQGLFGNQFTEAFQNQLFSYANSMPSDPVRAAEYIRANARYWGWDENSAKAELEKQNLTPEQQQQNNEQQLQQREQQQQRHASLSGIEGSSAPVELDAKALAAMPQEEFEKLLANPASAAKVDKLMGIS